MTTHNPFMEGFGKAQTAFLSDVLTRINLPVPDPGSFRKTADEGRVVLIDPAACVLRVTRVDSVDIYKHGADRHDRILQPLARFDGEGLVVAVNPGIHIPAMHRCRYFRDQDWIQQTHENTVLLGMDLAKDGYFRWYEERDNPYNVGILPQSENADFPDGFAVVLDPGAIEVRPYSCEAELKSRGLHDAVQSLRERAGDRNFNKGFKTPVQDEKYGGLRAAFAAALACGNARDAWAACARAKEEGRLVADWQTAAYCEPENSPFYITAPQMMPRVARAYAAQLAKQNFI